jgi:hypothetical protein
MVLTSKTKKILAISGGVLSAVIIITIVVYFATKPKPLNPTSPMSLLQSRIDNLTSGNTPINNLIVLGKLTIQNSNPDDIFTLKLISNSDTNQIFYGTYGNDAAANMIGPTKKLVSSQIPDGLPTTYTLSKPVPLPVPKNQTVPTLSSLETQINNIVQGKTNLNNLKVTGTLTFVSYGIDYPVFLNNYTVDSKRLGSCFMFANQDYINGYIGISGDYDATPPTDTSLYDEYMFNISSSSANVPTCPAVQPAPIESPVCSGDIDSLNKRLDDIISGGTKISYLVVNGDLTVTGTNQTLFSIQKAYTCASPCSNPLNRTQDPTLLIAFNNQTDAHGISGSGDLFDGHGFFGSANAVPSVKLKQQLIT